MLNKFFSLFSHDIGIDLGTANTLVHVRDKGIMIREPSVVAIHTKTKDILAIGLEAKEMIGKTPANIKAIRPLRNGVISDFDMTERMLSYFIKKVHATPSRFPKIPRPRVVVGVPSSVTEVEQKAVLDAARSAGAREAYLIEESMAAAIGAGLPVGEPTGSLVIDMGGGTTEIAVISLGGIVVSKSIRVAGDAMDQALVDYARSKYNLLIGERTAENLKVALGSVWGDFSGEATLRGRDLKSGLPKAITTLAEHVREALFPVVRTISQAVKDVIEGAPPELVSDLMKQSVILAGGTSQLRGLSEYLSEETHMKVRVLEDPQTAVVRGTGKVLENLDLLRRVVIK